VLRVYFPGLIETHCQIQDFFFDEKFELRRHDYSVNIAGGFPAAQLMLEYTDANGMRLPSKRRAYTRGPDRRPILEMLMVSIDITEGGFLNQNSLLGTQFRVAFPQSRAGNSSCNTFSHSQT
jgi:hypothetical protein